MQMPGQMIRRFLLLGGNFTNTKSTSISCFFEEAGICLRRDGFQVSPVKEGLMPVSWNGAPFGEGSASQRRRAGREPQTAQRVQRRRPCSPPFPQSGLAVRDLATGSRRQRRDSGALRRRRLRGCETGLRRPGGARTAKYVVFSGTVKYIDH